MFGFGTKNVRSRDGYKRASSSRRRKVRKATRVPKFTVRYSGSRNKTMYFKKSGGREWWATKNAAGYMITSKSLEYGTYSTQYK